MSWPTWTGDTVAVVASGPSAADEDLAAGRGRIRFLAVKDGWRLCPWAEVLYGCDDRWWTAHRDLPAYQGLRLAYEQKTIDRMGGLKVDIREGWVGLLFDRVGEVGWGGHSGFHAINLAMQFGARRLLLVGFDLRVDRGKHFFGTHPYSNEHPKPDGVERWRRILEGEAVTIRRRGVDVVNCSQVSALTAWPRARFAEVV